MKKLFISLCIAVCAMGVANAQDLEKLTEMYNAAATALTAGNKAEALPQFEQVLAAATALGETGNDIANNCKNVIPQLYVSVAKALANNKELDKAIEMLQKAITTGKEYNDQLTAEEAEGLISTLKANAMMTNANNLFNEKKYAEAAEAYKEIAAMDPTNATAVLRQGMALSSAGNFDASIECLTAALEKFADNESQLNLVKKNLANTFLKKSNGLLKTKDWKGALEAAQKSAEYGDSANAQKIIGNAASQLKQNKVAAEAFEAYLALKPNAGDKVQTIYQLATALMAMGDNAKACGYFKEIAEDPKFGEAARYQITQLKCN
ncbi:MAG: tetratricopeptide repeat protein [Bacteroidales bacterium]|nr:tetratricopeptide repeat protein [Bacteroidales bacterium]